MEYIIVAAIAAWLGWRAHDVYTKLMIRSIMEDMGLTEQQRREIEKHCVEQVEKALAEEQQEVPVKLEMVGEQIFAYAAATGEFMAQGSSREELFKNLSDRYKNLRCVVTAENGAELIKKQHG
jgi:hypothetical protein